MRAESISIRVNTGEGETSYSKNSALQKTIITTTRAVVEDTIKDILTGSSFRSCYTIADLGCGSGPNTFLVISNIIISILEQSKERNQEPPYEFQVLLNDLPGNDFNSIFKSTHAFYQKIEEEQNFSGRSCFVSGVPGSFYGRLFPTCSLNLVHSSSCLHWLSKAPEGLEDNKGSIYISKHSPSSVHLAYLKQFNTDFFGFLRSRKDEIVSGGRMVFVMGCMYSLDGFHLEREFWQLLSDILLEMAAEGLTKESDVDSCNIPYYAPSKEEVNKIIQEEGSFDIFRFEIVLIKPSTVLDTDERARIFALQMRAVTEPLLVCHFGDSVMNNLFSRLIKHLADNPSTVLNATQCYLVASLKKK